MARGSGSRDRTPPVVNITFPANGQVFTSAQSITITATATDNKAVARVEFYVQNNATGALGLLTSDTTSPYSASWPVPVQVGTYYLTAKAFDTSGNSATHTIAINRTDSTTTTTTTTAPPPPVLPSSKILTTPTAWYQGGEGSCNAMATALNRSIEEYYSTGATSYSESTNVVSPEWIYNLSVCSFTAPLTTDDFINPTCLGCGAGSAVLSNRALIQTYGVPRWSVCPYSYQNGCSTSTFTQAMLDDAANYKITNIARVSTYDIYTMKRMLCNNHSLHMDFQMDYNYYYAGSDVGIAPCDYVWKSVGTLMSTHSMVIIGYDDTKQAWLAQNSWGANWACNGKIWIAYDFLPVKTLGVWAMTTREDLNYFNIL